MRVLPDAELARPEPRTNNVTKLSAEVRFLNKAVLDQVWRLNPGSGVAKSERHQHAWRMRHHKTPPRSA